MTRRLPSLCLLSVCVSALVMPLRAANLSRVWQPTNGPDVQGTLVSQTKTAVTVRTSAGKTVTLPPSKLGDEDLRYLQNKREAVNPSRQWTFQDGQGTREFQASYVKTTGFDSPLSKTFIVLIHDDGRKHGYPLEKFSEADQAYVRQRQTAAPPVVSSDATPNDEFKVHWTDYDPVRDKAIINSHATTHFLFVWGNAIEPSAKNWADAQFRQMNFDYFEKVWNFNQNVQHAPMPYADAPEKFKTTVYITGTGLPNQKEGFAFGGITIEIHPGAMLAGSSVIPHEFTHTIQLHTGGYQGKLGPLIGWFWECHANWNACQFIPSAALALEVYNDRMHYELSSTRDNYGSWPFLCLFAEHPRFDPAFCFDVWTQNKKVGGDSVETPFETMMRLGAQRGQFTGNGIGGFGDMMGEMAAHNVTWDYVNQWTYQDAIATYHKNQGDASRDRTLLENVPDRPGWYRPLNAQSPRQYGINIVDLIPTPGAKQITANVAGIADPINGADWRVTLVAIDGQGRARYSRMWRNGVGTLTLRPGETRLALAVAGTPTIYKPQPFRDGYNVKPHFPYEVTFTGCAPSRVPDYLPPHFTAPGAAHPNGGGFVAATAHVDPTAFVGPDARVTGNAQVTGNARVEDHAIVTDDAHISDGAIVSGFATVRNHAQVTEQARVGGLATVENNVTLTGHARVREGIRVHGSGTVSDDVLVKGFGDLYTGTDSPLSGGTVIGQDSEIHADAWHKPITGGLLYGFMAEDQFSHEVTDNNGLYAHWDFNQPQKEILKDVFADNDGVLRHNPVFATDGDHHVLTLDGKTQYALLDGEAADTADFTLDMQIKWNGGAANQRVLTFVGPDGALSFTPKDASGHAVFIIRRGKTLQTLQATSAVPVGQWTHVTVTLSPNAAVMSFNGQSVARTTTLTLRPEDIRATAGYLGCSADRADFFHGAIDDIALYRTPDPKL